MLRGLPAVGSAFGFVFAFASGIVLVVNTPGRAEIVFESRPPGTGSGSQGISSTIFAGTTFRLLERTQIDSLGMTQRSFTTNTSFVSIYKINTPASVPDVAGDSNLLGSTLLELPGGFTQSDVSGALSLTLEPGWYAVVAGTGRYGATAGDFDVQLPDTGTASSPQVFNLAYTINASNNNRTLTSNRLRFFATGQTVDPVSPPPGTFLMETARPNAMWNSSTFYIDSSSFWGTRFTITDPTELSTVSSWLTSGNGSIFAAIVALPNPDANPAAPSGGTFANLVASTLINVGSGADEYTGIFDGVTLQPGSYALILGSGMLGATGSAGILGVSDQIVSPGSLVWLGSSWGNLSSLSFRMALTGSIVPEPATLGLMVAGLGLLRRRKPRASA